MNNLMFRAAWIVMLHLSFEASAQPLSLEEALRLGETQSPRLEAQRQAVASAEGQIPRAAELPDPKLRFGIENLPVSGEDRFRYNADSMTSRLVGIAQDLPNGAKRRARELRAQRGFDVEEAMLGSERAALQRDIAASWLAIHFAERTHAALERLVDRLASQAEASRAGVARGQQSAADAFILRIAVEQARDRVLDQKRFVSRARIGLGALLGVPVDQPLAAPPELNRLPHGAQELLQRLHEHPHLRVYDVRQELAQSEVNVARASRRPDWSVELGYGHRSPEFDNMLTLLLSVDLPWQRQQRQDRDIASRIAEAERARAQREEARRMHEAELRGWIADYQAATERIERYRAAVLPLARSGVEAALAGYRGGQGTLNSVLDAYRAATEADVAVIGMEAERATAWANLRFLYPHGESQ
jgi:outer membrane protein TolC